MSNNKPNRTGPILKHHTFIYIHIHKLQHCVHRSYFLYELKSEGPKRVVPASLENGMPSKIPCIVFLLQPRSQRRAAEGFLCSKLRPKTLTIKIVGQGWHHTSCSIKAWKCNFFSPFYETMTYRPTKRRT